MDAIESSMLNARMPANRFDILVCLPDVFTFEGYGHWAMSMYCVMLWSLQHGVPAAKQLKRVILVPPHNKHPEWYPLQSSGERDRLFSPSRHPTLMAHHISIVHSLDTLDIVLPDGVHWQTDLSKWRHLEHNDKALAITKEIDKFYAGVAGSLD